MATPIYRIINDGQGCGGFMCPPGHPNHSYVVHGYYGGRPRPVSGPNLIASLDYLIKNEYGDVPPDVQARAREIMDRAELTCSESWLRNVYGYFRNSYSPDGVNRNVGDSISSSRLHCECGEAFWSEPGLNRHLVNSTEREDHGRLPTPLPPPEHHLGYLCVREYFPDHEPRLDLIADPGDGYGAHPCLKCGKTIQYEARYDAWCVFGSGPACPEGGQHE
jgi:hypothetical protein